MPRYRLVIEYHGGPFIGWQTQPCGGGVQNAISDAIEKFTGERVTAYGAGRTDAGVHALGQVAHIDLEKDMNPFAIMSAFNHHIKPHPITIREIEKVSDNFDARFSATRRYYRYRIINRRSPLTIDRGLAWQVVPELDADAMHEAAQCLVGHHDFTTFRSVQCQSKSPVKTLEAIAVARYGNELEITCHAKSFLHNQVRSFVGSLKLVGVGKWKTADLKAALDAKSRPACGPVAPSDGLYLAQVDYLPADEIERVAEKARAARAARLAEQ